VTSKKAVIVQFKSDTTGLYVKLDRSTNTIIAYKKTVNPYKNVPIARNRKKKSTKEVTKKLKTVS
jgi:hypothetical protein